MRHIAVVILNVPPLGTIHFCYVYLLRDRIVAGSNEADNSVWVPVLLALLLAFILFLIWYVAGDHVKYLYKYLRIGELNLYLLANDWFIQSDALHRDLTRTIAQLKDLRFGTYDWNQMYHAHVLAVNFLRIPLCIGLFFLGMITVERGQKKIFNNKYDLEGLIKIQSAVWPFIKPIVNFFPADSSQRVIGDTIPRKLPTFAEALAPEEWLAFSDVSVSNGMPDRDAIRRGFIFQLGGNWKGAKALPPPRRALFAAFALKGVRKREEGEELLGQIAECWTSEEGFKLSPELWKKINQIVDDPKIGGLAEKIAAKHAFTTTAMIAVLMWARKEGGVLAPSYFLWLRAVDRRLWYPLNNTGRRSFHAEAAGVMAHYIAERKAERPLLIPRVETAVDSMVQYVVTTKPNVPPVETKRKRA